VPDRPKQNLGVQPLDETHLQLPAVRQQVDEVYSLVRVHGPKKAAALLGRSDAEIRHSMRLAKKMGSVLLNYDYRDTGIGAEEKGSSGEP
jgi:hypothetical protein